MPLKPVLVAILKEILDTMETNQLQKMLQNCEACITVLCIAISMSFFFVFCGLFIVP